VPARRVAATIGGAPKRGAGIGATRSRDPFTGCDRGADHRRVASMPILCASPGSDPKGPLFRPATRPLAGTRPRRRAQVPRMMARYCPATGSHPTMKPLEPAPPYAGHFVGRLAHIRDMSCAALRVIPDSGSQRTRASLCYGLLILRLFQSANRCFSSANLVPYSFAAFTSCMEQGPITMTSRSSAP